MKEFGKIVSVSKEYHDSNPEQSLEIIKQMFQREYDQYREKHFPEWKEDYRFLEGGVVVEKTLARVDGEEVSDEAMEQYLEYVYGDGPIFDFGDEYKLDLHELYQFAWYAVVPEELVLEV